MTIERHALAGGSPTDPGSALAVLGADADVVGTWLRGRKATTLKAYEADLRAFAAWTGDNTPAAAAGRLLAGTHGEANLLVHRWRGDMLAEGLAPASINRRLSALRSLVRIVHRTGAVGWLLDVEGVPHRPYRDTRGPGPAAVRAMLDCLPEDTAGRRAHALIRLLHDRGLRAGEAVSLDTCDIDLQGRRVRILGKGRYDPEWLSIAPPTCDSLAAWLDQHPTGEGALFVALDPGHLGQRLSRRSVGRIVADAAHAAGVGHVAPHGLRHSAITSLLDRNGGDVRAARAFSRHARLDTLMVYDDARIDLGGHAANAVAAALD